MNKMMIGAGVFAASAALPALADNVVATYTVTGNVGTVCSAQSTGSIPFGDLTDGTGTLNATNHDSSDSAYCNGAGTTIQVGHIDLTHKTFTGTPPAGFVKVVSFTPVVIAGSGVSQVTLTGDKSSGTPLGAFSGIIVRAASPAVTVGTKPLAGQYEGSIAVTLTPGL